MGFSFLKIVIFIITSIDCIRVSAYRQPKADMMLLAGGKKEIFLSKISSLARTTAFGFHGRDQRRFGAVRRSLSGRRGIVSGRRFAAIAIDRSKRRNMSGSRRARHRSRN
jgi:hypothetical protein